MASTNVENWSELLEELQGGNPIGVKGVVQTYPADTAQFVNLLNTTTSGATITRANGVGLAKLNLLTHYDVATFQCNLLSAATEAGDTLDVYIDLSLDSFTWFNAIHFTQMLGNGGAKIFVAQLCHPSAAVADINVTADAAAAAARNLWAPHVRAGLAVSDANANVNSIFSLRVDVALQAK